MSRRTYAEIQRQSISKDRVITDFPKAFRPDVTPYRSIDFSPKVRNAVSNSMCVKGIKVVVVGDVNVGKTCLVQRFCHDVFDRDYKATIGVDFEVEKFSILSVPFSLQVWDTAGQERFKSIAASYYRSASAVIGVFDFSSIHSLQKVKQWKEDACAAVEVENPLVFLVGSKTDLVSKSVYQEMDDHASRLANELRAEYWAVSSKSGENVKQLFFRIAALLFDIAVLREIGGTSGVKAIGNDLIKMPSNQKGTDYDTGNKLTNKLKCCH